MCVRKEKGVEHIDDDDDNTTYWSSLLCLVLSIALPPPRRRRLCDATFNQCKYYSSDGGQICMCEFIHHHHFLLSNRTDTDKCNIRLMMLLLSWIFSSSSSSRSSSHLMNIISTYVSSLVHLRIINNGVQYRERDGTSNKGHLFSQHTFLFSELWRWKWVNRDVLHADKQL